MCDTSLTLLGKRMLIALIQKLSYEKKPLCKFDITFYANFLWYTFYGFEKPAFSYQAFLEVNSGIQKKKKFRSMVFFLLVSEN